MKLLKIYCIRIYTFSINYQSQKELFGGGEAGPDGVTSRKMSNGSTGSPKLKWLKAFKSLKTSSPTTPPLSDKWATYFLFTNTNFHHVHAAKNTDKISDATDMVFYIGRHRELYLLSILYVPSKVQVPEMKEDHVCSPSKSDTDCLIRISLC